MVWLYQWAKIYKMYWLNWFVTCGGTKSSANVLPTGDPLAPLHNLPHQLPPVGHGGDGGPGGDLARDVLPHALLQPLVDDGAAAAHLELQVDLLPDGHGQLGILGQLGLGLDHHLVTVTIDLVHVIQGVQTHRRTCVHTKTCGNINKTLITIYQELKTR